jgi:peptidoglycan hydrolase-like protein with peptidoglycan-binding domain
MTSLRRKAAPLAIVAALLTGASALTAVPAVAAPTATDAVQRVQAWYCGYDDRVTPPTIRQGSSGNTVREAQCLLVFWGYSVGPSGIDGDFGSYTYAATRAFQRDCRIGVDGIIGPVTWNRLRNGC